MTENRITSDGYFAETISLEDKDLGLESYDGFYFRISSSSPNHA